MISCYLTKPDTSLAQKSGHFYLLTTFTDRRHLLYWTITCRTALWVRVPEVAVTVIV